MVLNGS
jgi:small subunit ribosomal protein S14e